MPLAARGVNLLKTCEVSYLQLDSYSTAPFPCAPREFAGRQANRFAKMALLLCVPASYPYSSNLVSDSGYFFRSYGTSLTGQPMSDSPARSSSMLVLAFLAVYVVWGST